MGFLTDKVLIVTGAGSGIGSAAAQACARRGAAVVLAGRRADKLDLVRERLTGHGFRAAAVPADVTRPEDVRRLFDETEKIFGPVDILVNNAGRGLKADILEIRDEDWREVLDTDLTSVFLCSREALRRMIKAGRRGHIITVSSIAGLYGTGGYAAYCAAKHGVTGFQRSLKWEARKRGVKVSTVFPGRVDTEFFDVYSKRPDQRQMLPARALGEYLAAIAERKPLKRHALRLVNIGRRVVRLTGIGS
jgi:NAD(P)-dependent dehydrogenase (short-subunit alcohol dehydrogenase family)